MKKKLSSAEFTDLMAYNSISPGGLERFDSLVALQCCTVANMLKGKGKPFTIKDFVMDWGREAEKVDWRDIKTKLKQFATRHNSRIEKKENKK